MYEFEHQPPESEDDDNDEPLPPSRRRVARPETWKRNNRAKKQIVSEKVLGLAVLCSYLSCFLEGALWLSHALLRQTCSKETERDSKSFPVLANSSEETDSPERVDRVTPDDVQGEGTRSPPQEKTADVQRVVLPEKSSRSQASSRVLESISANTGQPLAVFACTCIQMGMTH